MYSAENSVNRNLLDPRGRRKGFRNLTKNPQRDYKILSLRDSGKTLEEIGNLFGISRQRVNQILRPDKTRSRRYFYYWVKTGKVVKPDKCSDCGKRLDLQGHHYDHRREVDVEWLCVQCHVARHPGGFKNAPIA